MVNGHVPPSGFGLGGRPPIGGDVRPGVPRCDVSVRISPESMHLYVRSRQFDDERRAGTRVRANLEVAAHPLHELAGDVEAEAGAARRTGQLGARAVELLEDPLLLRERDPGAGIGHEDAYDTVGGLDANVDR